MPKTRFFAWYRLIPLTAVFAFGLISFVYSYAPAVFFKPLYPIDYEAYVKQSSISHNLDPYLVCCHQVGIELGSRGRVESRCSGIDAADARDCSGYDRQGPCRR